MNNQHSEPKAVSQKKEEPDFFSFENFKSLSILALLIFALRSSIISPYHVPTASMEPTIKVGDRLLAVKFIYNLRIPFTDIPIIQISKVKRGDIIVFRYPEDPDIDFVKRVVGIAGDRIKMVEDVLYINGEAQNRVDHNSDRSILEDIHDKRDLKNLYRETLDGVEHWSMNLAGGRHESLSNWPREGEIVVPDDSVYVMGDNRDNSKDSRKWGRVPLSYIRGKALFVLWSMYVEDDGYWPPIFRFTRFFSWLDTYTPPKAQ